MLHLMEDGVGHMEGGETRGHGRFGGQGLVLDRAMDLEILRGEQDVGNTIPYGE